MPEREQIKLHLSRLDRVVVSVAESGRFEFTPEFFK